jgi:hypothetical protein
MIFGFGASFGAAGALARGGCDMARPTKINVKPTTKDVQYDFRQDLKSIQKVKIDTINPYGHHHKSFTQGFMKGAIKMEPTVSLDYKHSSFSGTCLWYDEITIKIEIDPTIVIAREVARDRCMKAAVMEHEMKHVMADRKLVNKYAKIMGEKLHDELKKRGFVVGPVPSNEAQDTAKKMQDLVFQILEHQYKKMDLERHEVQNAIDNLEEYERVNALCPQFKKKNAHIYAIQ